MEITQRTNIDVETLKAEIVEIVRKELNATTINFSGEILNNEQVCQILGISSRQLARLRQQKRIAYSQFGRKIFYQRKDVEAFINSYRIETV